MKNLARWRSPHFWLSNCTWYSCHKHATSYVILTMQVILCKPSPTADEVAAEHDHHHDHGSHEMHDHSQVLRRWRNLNHRFRHRNMFKLFSQQPIFRHCLDSHHQWWPYPYRNASAPMSMNVLQPLKSESSSARKRKCIVVLNWKT